MEGLSPSMPITMLGRNDLDTPIRSQRLSDYVLPTKK